MAHLWDTGTLWRCDKMGVYFRPLGRSRSEVTDVRIWTQQKCDVSFSFRPTKSPEKRASTSQHFVLTPNGCHLGNPKSQDVRSFASLTLLSSLPRNLTTLRINGVGSSSKCSMYVSSLFTSRVAPL